MHLDGARHLPLLPEEIAEDQVYLECLGVDACGGGQFFDRQVELVRDQEVEPEDVVR